MRSENHLQTDEIRQSQRLHRYFSAWLNAMDFDPLRDIDTGYIDGNLRSVKIMSTFIRRALPAIFACTFMKTLFTSTATSNRTLLALIYTIEN